MDNSQVEAKRQEIQTVYEFRVLRDIAEAQKSVTVLLSLVKELVNLINEEASNDC